MTSCCNGCGVGLLPFPVSPIYAYLPNDVLMFHLLRRRVVYTAVQIRAQHVSQLKTVVRAQAFESWPSDKGVNSK